MVLAADTAKDGTALETETWQTDPPSSFSGVPVYSGLDRVVIGQSLLLALLCCVAHVGAPRNVLAFRNVIAFRTVHVGQFRTVLAFRTVFASRPVLASKTVRKHAPDVGYLTLADT